LIGLGGFLTSMWLLLREAFTRRFAIRDPAVRSLQFGAIGSLAGAMAAGIFDHFFFNMQFPHTVALFWLLAGLTAAATEIGAPTERQAALFERGSARKSAVSLSRERRGANAPVSVKLGQ
ncbi:MAG: hypothetical protein NTZ05_05825, partial [Chloroflexi bacterium]|nr:hypothetical protein [Chloroflexota bacterium]